MSAFDYSYVTKQSRIPQSESDDCSKEERNQNVDRNRDTALRYLQPAQEFDPSLRSVVDEMKEVYQMPKADARKVLDELTELAREPGI